MNSAICYSHAAASTRRLASCLLTALLLVAYSIPDRAIAATIVVDSLDDADPFDTSDDKCTLREAIANANHNANNTADTSDDCAAGSGADIITFSVAGTITMTAGRYITSDDTKVATNDLTIDGDNKITISGDGSHKVLLVVDTPLTLANITVADGLGDISGNPGGIENLNTLSIRNSTLTRNVAKINGGAIQNSGDLEIIGSTLSDNEARDGSGGAIYTGTTGATIVLKNSTVSGNSALSGGGGGIWSDSPIEIVNSTVTANSAADGGGLTGSGTFTIANSIIANNSASTSDTDCDSPMTIIVSGNDVDTGSSCVGFGHTTSADLKLGPLFLNGGSTRTHALLAGSVAIDAGVQSVCDSTGITEDQRGESRPADGNADGVSVCDLGAYEVVPPPPPVPADLAIAKSAAKTAKTGRQLTYTISVKNWGPNTAPNVLINDLLPAGVTFVALSAPGATTCSTPLAGFTGTVSCSYGSLASGASITPITLNVKVTAKGSAQLNNTATVSLDSASTVDPNSANNSATATTKVSK
jgi:uncharacterized repeat protein (TIGR01451 family)/CSLREA domain-containing protein